MNPIVISYFPFITEHANGKFLSTDNDEIVAMLDSVLNSNANALCCAWLEHDGKIMPAFAFERAKDLHDDIVKWAEGDVASWFTLDVVVSDDCYCMMLSPNVLKTVERMSRTLQIADMKPIDSGNCKVLCKGLSVTSKVSKFIQRWLGETKEGDTIDLGLIEGSSVQCVNTRLDPHWLRGVTVRFSNEQSKELLLQYIKDFRESGGV